MKKTIIYQVNIIRYDETGAICHTHQSNCYKTLTLAIEDCKKELGDDVIIEKDWFGDATIIRKPNDRYLEYSIEARLFVTE